ncbi:hypothetical protein ACTXT7_011337, partial [Hymenolepis weldensis]
HSKELSALTSEIYYAVNRFYGQIEHVFIEIHFVNLIFIALLITKQLFAVSIMDFKRHVLVLDVSATHFFQPLFFSIEFAHTNCDFVSEFQDFLKKISISLNNQTIILTENTLSHSDCYLSHKWLISNLQTKSFPTD